MGHRFPARARGARAGLGNSRWPNSSPSGKAKVASAKKAAAKMKSSGKGIFKVRTLSSALAAITGKGKMTTGPLTERSADSARANGFWKYRFVGNHWYLFSAWLVDRGKCICSALFNAWCAPFI